MSLDLAADAFAEVARIVREKDKIRRADRRVAYETRKLARLQSRGARERRLRRQAAKITVMARRNEARRDALWATIRP